MKSYWWNMNDSEYYLLLIYLNNKFIHLLSLSLWSKHADFSRWVYILMKVRPLAVKLPKSQRWEKAFGLEKSRGIRVWMCEWVCNNFITVCVWIPTFSKSRLHRHCKKKEREAKAWPNFRKNDGIAAIYNVCKMTFHFQAEMLAMLKC